MINVKVKSLKHMKGYHKCKNYFFTFSLFFFLIMSVELKDARPILYW